MIPKLAIEKAIEGGWKPKYEQIERADEYTGKPLTYFDGEVALDPAFWQALGKALGWHNASCVHDWNWSKRRCDNELRPSGWMPKARRFYDIILEGKNTADYWKELLN